MLLCCFCYHSCHKQGLLELRVKQSLQLLFQYFFVVVCWVTESGVVGKGLINTVPCRLDGSKIPEREYNHLTDGGALNEEGMEIKAIKHPLKKI